MLWLSAKSNSCASSSPSTSFSCNPIWGEVSKALVESTNNRMDTPDIVDCTIFVPLNMSEERVAAIENEAKTATTNSKVSVAAQLTLVKTTIGVGNDIKLRCTAIIGGGSDKKQFKAVDSSSTATSVTTVTAGGFAYVSGVGSTDLNATDGFAEISRSLQSAGSRMNLVRICVCVYIYI